MLTVHNTEAIRQIEAAIGYTFHDKRLLVQVLTRKTYLKIDPEAPDNEVLEFYGDTLMNYHVTNYFMAKYAHMLDDGLFFMRTVEQFTDLRSHYVCNRYLTDRVKALGLARYLRAQNRDAELRRDGEKAYADIFESLVGAIYLDSYQNESLIRAFILRQLGIDPRRTPAEIESFDYDTLADFPESIALPAEEEVFEPMAAEVIAPAPASLPEPAPLPEAMAEPAPASVETPAEASEAAAPAIAEASAMEAAAPSPEEAAAELFRAAVTEPASDSDPSSAPSLPRETSPAASKQAQLAALCESLGYEAPTYGETPPNAPNARPVAACTLKYKDAKGKPIKISLNDSGRTLAEATEKAAGKMLLKLEKAVEADTQKRVKQAKKDELDKLRKQLKEQAVKESAIPEETAPVETAAPAEETAPVEVAAPVWRCFYLPLATRFSAHVIRKR